MSETEPRPEKVAVVDEVKRRIGDTDAVLLTDYRGIDVAAMQELRRSLHAAGGDYKIYKNTLVRFAVRDLELDLEQFLTGPTALAFVAETPDGDKGDAVTVAKALRDFSRTNEHLVIKGGLLGDLVLSADEAKALAEIAPRDELLARFAAGLAAPMQKFATLLGQIPRNFAYALKALIDQGGAPSARTDEAVPDGVGTPADSDAAQAPAEASDTDVNQSAEPASEDSAAPATEESPSTDGGADEAQDDPDSAAPSPDENPSTD